MKYLTGISHADIITTHDCNMACKYCIDKFKGTSKQIIEIDLIKKFLKMLYEKTYKINFAYDNNPKTEILLLGGEPTLLGESYLKEIADWVHKYDFEICMSTNGINKDVIKNVIPFFDWVQITCYNDAQIMYWKEFKDNINIKLPGDERLNLQSFKHFIDMTRDFGRKSLSMYFKPNFESVCKDIEFNEFLDSLKWERFGSYLYTFYDGVRIKKCISGVTNIEEEPLIPKLYPNGNYNKTWQNEENDEYIGKL